MRGMQTRNCMRSYWKRKQDNFKSATCRIGSGSGNKTHCFHTTATYQLIPVTTYQFSYALLYVHAMIRKVIATPCRDCRAVSHPVVRTFCCYCDYPTTLALHFLAFFFDRRRCWWRLPAAQAPSRLTAAPSYESLRSPEKSDKKKITSSILPLDFYFFIRAIL